MNFDKTRGNSYGVRHVLSPQSGSIDQALLDSLAISPEKTKSLLEFGSIYLKGQRCLKNEQVEQGDYIRVHQNPRRFPSEIFSPKEHILFETDDYFLIDKPSGLPVHPTVDNIQENILSLMEKFTGQPAYVTHRLDVPTSGLLIVAKSKNSQSKINSLFANGKVKKIYRAQVSGQNPPLGELVHFMEPSPRAPKVVSQFQRPGWQICKLNIIDSTATGPTTSELQIELLTGRTHQIRAQLGDRGFPIIGDLAYGSKEKISEFEKIHLQCSFLSFPKDLEGLENEEVSSFRLQKPAWKREFQI